MTRLINLPPAGRIPRLLDPAALRALARGCGVLGAGGGGDTRVGLLQALQATEAFGPVPLFDLDALPVDALIMPCGMIGAPHVRSAKPGNGDEVTRLREHLEHVTGRRVAALMALEIGGSNGLVPVSWAARAGLPLVDADGAGRSFPAIPQAAMALAGIEPGPAFMTDERGNVIEFRAISGPWMERVQRAAAVELGGSAALAAYALTVALAREATVRNSVSFAIRIGTLLTGAQRDPIARLVADVIGVSRLVAGEVSDVRHASQPGSGLPPAGGAGHPGGGSMIIEGHGKDAGRLIRLELQDGNIVALEQGRVLASVPDLITVLDSGTAEAIPAEQIRHGQRVTLIALGCDPVWRSAAGLAEVGPRAFGYDIDYRPVQELAAARRRRLTRSARLTHPGARH